MIAASEGAKLQSELSAAREDVPLAVDFRGGGPSVMVRR